MGLLHSCGIFTTRDAMAGRAGGNQGKDQLETRG